MSYFSTALAAVVQRSFGGKHSSLGLAAGIDSSEIGRLIREVTPCTAAKLDKLCAAAEMQSEDRFLLVTSAVRDLCPPDVWQVLYNATSHGAADRVCEASGQQSIEYYGVLPTRALQVLRYLVENAQRDPDIVQALELLGRLLELPDLPE